MRKTTPPERLTAEARAEAARRRQMVGDTTTLMSVQEINDDLGRNRSATRRLFGVTREWMNDDDLDLTDPETEAALWEVGLPVPTKWLDPVNEKYPRWSADLYIRWAVKSKRLSADLSTSLSRSSGGRGQGVKDKAPSVKTLAHQGRRDAVVNEYVRQIGMGRDNQTAFEWVADRTGVPVRIAKRLLLEARDLPSVYGTIPTAAAGSRRRRREAVDRYNDLRRAARPMKPAAARKAVAGAMDLPESSVDRMLREGLRQPAIYGHIDYPEQVWLLPKSAAVDGPSK
jgi:hypothetical protein